MSQLSPKRILHVCSPNFFRYGDSYYSSDWKIRNGLIRNGHHVVDFSYREVVRWENIFRTTRLGAGKMNQRLIEAIDRVAPDLILFGHCELVTPGTLKKIKKKYPDIRMAQWYVDSYVFPEKHKQLQNQSGYLDSILTTTGGDLLQSLKQANNEVSFFPNMCDRSIESYQNYKVDSLGIDFLFCGRDYNPERTKRIRSLISSLSDLKCEVWGCLGNPPLTGHSYYKKLSEAGMSLNLSHREDLPFYTSGRMTQLLGNGILTFTPKTPGMEKLFSPEEVIFYDNDYDLIDKIKYFSVNNSERKEIAENGWKKVHSSYSGERVTKFMMEFIFGKNFSEEYEWLNA